ncbi:siderophore-interacting protein [Auritidibacter ignavus]|uniref:siderophore-interacting protein n=1 Tax=Auritidibacter ignavus TaxID=678932 RepID=UPI00244A8237|nr:siderophore-interacting protein [Auritidibacter ignavus]WGH85946.1 siderophore-interacting protein [Auritidibacter ignavus]WGH88233.1 siderophore-interacting protein [Auritidibacter ignavus]
MSEKVRPARTKNPAHLMEIVGTERLSAHFIRLTFGGGDFEQFLVHDSHSADRYIKLLLPPDPSLGLKPPFDLDALRTELPKHQLPVRRTYSVHSIDPVAQSFQVDFVLHGDAGVAGPWAARAAVGDPVQFSGPGGQYTPNPQTEWHLWAGDEAALPAIAASLAELAETNPAARGVALLEVAGADDEFPIVAPQGVQVRYLHRGGPFTPQTAMLTEAVRDVAWPKKLTADYLRNAPHSMQAFVHGEREVIKQLRAYLMDERGLSRAQLSLSAYWAYGRVEDAFQAEKREPIGQIYPAEQQ